MDVIGRGWMFENGDMNIGRGKGNKREGKSKSQSKCDSHGSKVYRIALSCLDSQ